MTREHPCDQSTWRCSRSFSWRRVEHQPHRPHRVARLAFANVPRESLLEFLRALHTGDLDELVARYARRRRRGAEPRKPPQPVLPGLFDELGSRRALLAPERHPDGRVVRAGASPPA